MPTFLRTGPSWRSARWVISSPSTQTSPEVGLKRPMRCLSSTLFPQPERPSTTQVSPRFISRSTPRSTCWRAEGFVQFADGNHAAQPP